MTLCKLNSEGKLLKMILKDYDHVKVTKKDKEEFFEWLPSEMVPTRDRIELPKEYPIILSLSQLSGGQHYV